MLSTSTTGADFFQAALGQDIFDVASRYESYLLAGVKSKLASTQCYLCILISYAGVVANHQQKLLTLKRDTAALILQCLRK